MFPDNVSRPVQVLLDGANTIVLQSVELSSKTGLLRAVTSPTR